MGRARCDVMQRDYSTTTIHFEIRSQE